jgi:fibronectin-binding autotransporter adhesin
LSPKTLIYAHEPLENQGFRPVNGYAVKYGSAGFNGTLVLDNAASATATFKDTGDFSGNLTVMDVNSPGNLQSLSVAGTVTSGSSILVGGILNDSTIGANSGTVSAGSISAITATTNNSGGNILANGSITGLSVTENDGTISVSGSGTASNVSIGSNAGNLVVGQAGNPDAGTISKASLGANSGTVSAGSISSMTVTTNSSGGSILAGSSSGLSITENAGHISIAGQSTADNTSIGTNDGSFVVGSSTDQGSTTNTTIGTNNGSFSTGSGTTTTISSNSSTGSVSMGSSSGMTVTTNSGGISIVGQSTAENTSIGTNDGSFVVGSSTDQGSTTNTTIGTNNGSFSTGSGTSTTISSNSSTGSVSMGSSSGMTVTTNSGGISIVGASKADNTSIGTNNGTFVVGNRTDLGSATNTTIGTLGTTGTFTATGTITSLNLTVFSGLVVAGHITDITVTNAPDASQMFNVLEDGVMRSLVLTPIGSSQPPSGTVNYVYDHNSMVGSPNYGDGQLTMAVNDSSTCTGSYDVELLSSSAAPGSGFDLAALYNACSSPAHIRNVLIEGNLAPSAGDANLIGINSTAGGIQLAGSALIPGTQLASVGIMGNAPAGSINAASVQAVSFASITEIKWWGGTVTIPAFVAAPWDAAQLLAPGTAIVQANNTFLAAAGQSAQGQSQLVALFLDAGKSSTFDPHSVLLGNQGGVVGATNPVLAQVTATDPPSSLSTIRTIDLTGDGGSIWTAQEIVSSITSSGALGDLILQAPQGIEANVTAPSIFGNIVAPNGSISGIIQATAGNIGRALSFCNGFVLGVTSIEAASGLTGGILSAGDLISRIDVNSGFRGTVAAGGNLGCLQPTPWGGLDHFGGMNVTGGFYGDAVVLGDIYGDVSISGGMNGRIAAGQGILGNININGGMGNGSAIVCGGEIGDPGLGTDLAVNGAVKGILAAVGTILYDINGTTKFATIVSNATGNNAAAIDAIFSGLTIGNLVTLVTNLNSLHVG